MSRIGIGRTDPETGHMDVRPITEIALAHGFVAFMNGVSGLESFGWVTEILNQIAEGNGVKERFSPLTSPTDEVALRKKYLRSLRSLESVQIGRDDSDFTSDQLDQREYDYEVLDAQLRPLQIVTFWRVRGDGKVIETELPRLDSVERCCAYVLGLALLDRHNLQRGIKRCRLMANIAPKDRLREIHRLWHWFIDIPNSKQLYCCTQHAQTARKRRERADPKRSKARKPK